jgi:hypothetical protein
MVYMTRFRFPVLVLTLFALLLVPVAGGATAPQKGVHYAGLVTVQQGSERAFEFPLSFYVDPSGQEVGPFVFPEGTPFGTKCAEGPLGEPAGDRHARVERGGFDVWLPLEIENPDEIGNAELGAVHLRGSFRPHGLFAGQLDNRTTTKICRGSWTFKLHAQPR